MIISFILMTLVCDSGWYCKEKLDVSHSYGVKGLINAHVHPFFGSKVLGKPKLHIYHCKVEKIGGPSKSHGGWLEIHLLLTNNEKKNEKCIFCVGRYLENVGSDFWLTARFPFQIVLYFLVEQRENLMLPQKSLSASFFFT